EDLAGNPNLSSEAAQQTLAQDRNDDVREALARNPSLNSEVTQGRQAHNLNRSIQMILRRIVPADR
ncbi:MAG: hypothetical protein P8176_10710, partial [Gammaproteobacteria bacterium]